MTAFLHLGPTRNVSLDFVRVDADNDSAVWMVDGGEWFVETVADPTDAELVEAVVQAMKEEA